MNFVGAETISEAVPSGPRIIFDTQYIIFKNWKRPGMVVHTYNCSTWETKAEGSGIQGQSQSQQVQGQTAKKNVKDEIGDAIKKLPYSLA